MKRVLFGGSIVAIVTPFINGMVDELRLRQLVDFQIDNGTDAIVACGTTGESSTLDEEEHLDVIRIVHEQANGRVPVIAGTGANATDEAINLTLKAKVIGVDGVLLVTPYYNKPTQEGLYRHYTAIAKAVDIPQILYNVPGRTGVNMLPDTVARISVHPNVVAIKEATGSLQQASEVMALCGDQIDVLSGDDYITLPMMACGAKGVISVLANIMPKTVSDLVRAIQARDTATAKRLNIHIQKISSAMFIESNPIPVKTALGLMGRCTDEVRLPLCEMGAGNKEKLATILREYKLI